MGFAEKNFIFIFLTLVDCIASKKRRMTKIRNKKFLPPTSTLRDRDGERERERKRERDKDKQRQREKQGNKTRE